MNFPAIATGILLPHSTAVDELDLLESERQSEGAKLTFIVHSQAELDKVSQLSGLHNVRIDPRADEAFWNKNKPFGRERKHSTRGHRLLTGSIAGYPCYRNTLEAFGVDQRIDGAAKVGEHKTSMLQDFERGRRLEIGAIVEAVSELGQLVSVPTPTIDTLLALTSLVDEQLNP